MSGTKGGQVHTLPRLEESGWFFRTILPCNHPTTLAWEDSALLPLTPAQGHLGWPTEGGRAGARGLWTARTRPGGQTWPQVWAFQHGSPRPRARLESFHQGKGFLVTGHAASSHPGHVVQPPPSLGCGRPLPCDLGPLANVGVRFPPRSPRICLERMGWRGGKRGGLDGGVRAPNRFPLLGFSWFQTIP